MAKKKNNNTDELLKKAGFNDLPSALAAIDSMSEEMAQCELDYELLVNKVIDLEDEVMRMCEVIIGQAIEIHNLKSVRVCRDCR